MSFTTTNTKRTFIWQISYLSTKEINSWYAQELIMPLYCVCSSVLCLQYAVWLGSQQPGIQAMSQLSIETVLHCLHSSGLVTRPAHSVKASLRQRLTIVPQWDAPHTPVVFSLGFFILYSVLSCIYFFLSSSIWLIFSGLGQMGKHCVASMAFPWCLCNSCSAPSEESRNTYTGFLFGDGNCKCSWGVKLASHGHCGF